MTPWRRLLSSSLLLLGLILLPSCATSKGALYSRAQEADAVATTPENPPPEPAEKPDKGINVVTYPSGATVMIAGQIYGTTPVVIEDLEPGSYTVVLEKRGYHTAVVRIEYDGTSMVLATNLEQMTGFLQVTAEPPEAIVQLDGRELPPAGARVPVGSYKVTVRAFGYEEQVQEVEVVEDALTSLHLVLRRAAFALSWLDASRTTFNPANYGNLGTTRLYFRVTAAGSGRLTVSASDGTEVLAQDFPSFDSWDHEVIWDGRDSARNPLPDGEYRVRLEARGADGNAAQADLTVRLDRSAVIVYRSLFSGASGLLYAPSPETLPRGSVQFSALGLAHVEVGTASYRLPVALGLRVGLPAAEVDAEVGGCLSSSAESLPLFASVSGRWAYAPARGPSGFSGAIGARLAYNALTTDTLTDFTGISVSAPVRLALGPVSLILAPELIASYRRVSYGEPSDAAFRVWGYGRAGLLVDAGPLMIGVSTALRLAPFSEGFYLDPPFSVGVEAHLTIPRTQIVVSAAVAAELAGDYDYYVMAGGGFGFLQ